ncbi:MAG: hypothetical protein HKN63_02985 [Rhodobacteraceae bacterium]|nr:hypothetical protein [Paracoccaceae bacterium]
MATTPNSFIVRERDRNKGGHRAAERILGVLGAGFILCGCTIWLLPDGTIGADALPTRIAVSIGAAALGLALYVYGTRGYQPEFGINVAKKEIWLRRLNAHGRSRVTRKFAKKQVVSVFIGRPQAHFQDAALFLRLKGRAQPICLVHGPLAELEAVHRTVCDTLAFGRRPQDAIPAKRPVRRRFGKKAEQINWQRPGAGLEQAQEADAPPPSAGKDA